MPGADSETVSRLAEPLRTNALALVAASNGRVWINSGWRSRAHQEQLYVQNCGSLDAPTSACHPATARPGTSQHERGQAVDLGGDMALAAQLAPRFSMVRTVPSENWHYESTGNRAGIADVGGSVGGAFGDAITNPVGTLTSAAGTIVDVVAKLSDGHLWVRIAMVVGGLAMVATALTLLGVDITKGLGDGPGAGQIQGAAGAGKALA